MIKVALVGCGKISHSHIEAFDKMNTAKIVAACDILEDNLELVCEKTKAKGYCNYKEMLKKEDVDLAVISLPHYLHEEATCFAAEQKIDIFLEKPMATTVEACERMIEVCKKNNVMLWVGHPYRYSPAYIRAKELVCSGELGSLVSFAETRNVFYFSDTRPRWFLQKKLSGGGIMMNLGAHCLDKLKFFSDSEIEQIDGSIHIKEGFDCEDSAQVFVKMKNGVSGLLNLIGHTAANLNITNLYLTKGEIRISDSGEVSYCGEDGVFKNEQHLSSEMEPQIADVIKQTASGDKKPVVSGIYGLDIIRAIDRLYVKNGNMLH